MKIGILTYHRSQNYGALLQAVALRKVLASMGHDVSFIDYWPDYHKKLYKVIDWELLRMPNGVMSLYFLLRSLRLYGPRKRRSDAFEAFISRYILPDALPYAKEPFYDVVVYGSDQIWRKQDGLGGVFNPVYFGNNILSAKRSISYAASMGIIHSGEEDKRFLKDRLSRFSDVLVREESLKGLLDDCGTASSVVLDPTLLLQAEDWKKMFDLKPEAESDYLLFYDLQTDSIGYSVVKEYAARKNLRIKVIKGEPHIKKEDGIEYIDSADPEKFVRLFYNAKAVITSSYHGLVFSLLFNKEFFTVFTVNSDRAKSLLTRLSLTDRMLPPHADSIPDCAPIDYGKANAALQGARRESLRKLSEALLVTENHDVTPH